MIHFFHRGRETRSCEMRLAPDGPGLDLVITEGRRSHVEHFDDVRTMENRQIELRYAWLAHGWRTSDPADAVDEQE